MTYQESMSLFSEEEKSARVIRLYYEDQDWYPCVPILLTTRARIVPHPSCATINVVRVVEVGENDVPIH